MVEPTLDDIREIQLIVGCDEDLARRWLKAKNNNADAAVSAIFDGEDLAEAEKTITWDESNFSADRNGNTTYGPQNYSFDNDNLHPLGQSAAPTRGTSPAPSLRQPSTRAEEDAEMQQAIAASQQDNKGSVGFATNFRPATKDHYDPSNWAMTTVSNAADSHQASEIIPDLEPHERQNQPGEPRFLKQLPSGDYLPSLLTIAHSIPLARRALLLPHKSYSSYGSDSEWWKGHPIRLPRIVSTVSGAPLEPATTERDDMLAEMQRLMALLDESSRSYGSAESLANLASTFPINRSDITSDVLLDRVLQAWETAAKDASPEHSEESEVFHSLIGTNSSEGLSTPSLWSLPLTAITDTEPTVNLAEVMDNTLWDMDADEEAFCDNFMEKCAHVLPMRLTQGDSSKEKLNVIVPATFYVDKYLKENINATRDIRKQMAQNKKKIEKIENVQFKLRNYKHPQTGSHLDVTLMLKHSIDYFSGKSRKILLEEREAAGAGGEVEPPSPTKQHDMIADQLNEVCEEIASKLEALEKEKDKARKALAQMSEESQLSPALLKHKYSLRGVTTKPHVTYVLRPRDPSDNDMVDDEDAPEGMQWWRIEYDVQVNGSKVMKTKSTQDDVIRAVEHEYNQALLVYASEQAISDDANIELPQGLKRFIQQDDEHFRAESQMNDYGNVNVYPDFENSHQRRASADSTIVNFDNDEPPAYDDVFDDVSINMQDRKVPNAGGDSPPAHEIKLDDESAEDEGGVEMVEKAHAPLYSLTSKELPRSQSDSAMTDVEQFDGESKS